MNIESDNPAFDIRAKSLHAASLANVSPATLQRLRSARDAARQAHGPRWRRLLIGTALSGVLPALLGVAIGLPYLLRHDAPGATRPTQAHRPAIAAQATNKSGSGDDYTAALDENPDLYLWMESDGKQLAMESSR